MADTFFAILSRMKYIERWALMRNARPENLSEHSLEVAMIAHALCVLGNTRHGRNLHAERAALIGLYHDAAEIVTGDMPTPVKYANHEIRDAYRGVEGSAIMRLLEQLPEDIRPVYEDILCDSKTDGTGKDSAESESEVYLRRLVKAADKISALIKCIDEENAGNREFVTARTGTEETIAKLRQELPEVDDFCREMLPAYGKTLDELL